MRTILIEEDCRPGCRRNSIAVDLSRPVGATDGGAYESGYNETYYGQYAGDEPYYDNYEPEHVEDKVYRIIKDVRDLTGIAPQ
jgi:hypothetical protein